MDQSARKAGRGGKNSRSPAPDDAELVLEVVPASDEDRRRRLLALLLRSPPTMTVPELESIMGYDPKADLRALIASRSISRRRTERVGGSVAWRPSLRVRRAHRPGRLA
jgi:hypothetical protein